MQKKEYWISIKDRLPEIGTPYKGFMVWICNPDHIENGYASVVRFSKRDNRFLIEDDHSFKTMFDEKDTFITHWGPLPNAPDK